MQDGDEWLKTVAGRMNHEVEQDAAPTSERLTVRDFLQKYGYVRRGALINGRIRNQLDNLGLRTNPDFELVWIDGEIEIEIEHDSKSDKSQHDRIHRVEMLAAANNKPVSVPPDACLSIAITRMMAYDYSQLPVMQGERDVKGIVSWKSIGSRLSLVAEHDYVRDNMVPAKVITKDTTLFEAIGVVTQHDYVLVRDPHGENVISGIVTASDLSNQFGQLAGPFLLVGEIEGHLRSLIHRKFCVEDMRTVAASSGGEGVKKIDGASDLTLGDYCRLLENAEYWKRLKLRIDRKEFVKYLDCARVSRNNVMHFNADGQPDKDFETLSRVARLLRSLVDY